MERFNRPLALQEVIIKDLAASKGKKQLDVIGLAALNANKYYLPNEIVPFFKEWRKQQKQITLNPDPNIFPLWIEYETPFPSFYGQVSGLLFSSPHDTNKRWKKWAHRGSSFFDYASWSASKWALMLFNAQGHLLTTFVYAENTWALPTAHLCPNRSCNRITIPISKKHFKPVIDPCKNCQAELKRWTSWFVATLALILRETTVRREKFYLPHFHFTLFQRTDYSISVLKPPPQLNNTQQPMASFPSSAEGTFASSSPSPKQPPSVPSLQNSDATHHPLLIDHYIDKHDKKAETIEQSHKYLWMHSAWIMTEALRLHTDDIPLQLPTYSIYIELEQPHQIHEHEIAAFSFLQNEKPYWTLSVINTEGQTIWQAFYEEDVWTLPNDYACPKQQCITKKIEGVTFYTLCTACQGYITFYTSWLAIALRMIAGDFQEHIDMQEPEVTFEPSSKKRTVHRYQIIRYHDASRRKDRKPQTKRGSWMSGRILAENEYELDLNAIIYVQIQPKEHDRTYRHQRYTTMRGKTQHIDPHPRLQPMTIATFRQLKQIQRITKVSASKFEQS